MGTRRRISHALAAGALILDPCDGRPVRRRCARRRTRGRTLGSAWLGRCVDSFGQPRLAFVVWSARRIVASFVVGPFEPGICGRQARRQRPH
jgi:hypothetical protein